MRVSSTFFLALLSTCTAATRPRPTDYDNNDYYAVHIDPQASITSLAESLGLSVHGPIGYLQDHYLLEGPKQTHDIVARAVSERKRRKRTDAFHSSSVIDNVLLHQKQVRRRRLFKRESPPASLHPRADSSIPPVNPDIEVNIALAKKLDIKDPIYQEQWHHFNTVQKGHDLNVTGVWTQGITGKNSTSCIIDDGLDFNSQDLADNYYKQGSHDFNDAGPDPLPRLSDDRHGTRCAGEIAAVRNNVCGVGIAYDSKVAGVRILSGPISDADEAIAITYDMEHNDIYSCSWGPPDDGKAMEGPDILIQRAILTGIQKGRNGLGSLFVFAIGNGAHNDDNCNFDGYTNSIYSVSVGGIDRKGLHPYYSEKCSAQLVVTYSSGSGDAIHTTDVGKDTCYAGHGGTSAAGPLVAGVFALINSIRPDLHWRDYQWLTALTAVPVNEDEEGSEYQDTSIGLRFSHQYGYGKIDAWAIVEKAKTWKSVKPQAWYFSPWMHVKKAIPQGKVGLTSSFTITEAMLKEANLEKLEHVTVTMNIDHGRRGDLSVDLKSPHGIISHLATSRRLDDAQAGYVDWTFMSVAHFGESGVGEWTVIVKDTNVNKYKGKFTDWRIKLWGEAKDAKSQTLLPLPDKHDDDGHDVETISATVGTTHHGEPPKTGALPDAPTDLPTRPVNAKPTADAPTSDAKKPPGDTGSGSVTEDEKEPSHSGVLPSKFPTFGASKKTQVWMSGAVGLIVIFCASLCIWHLIVRRRRKRNARDEYEFEMLDEEDIDDDDDDEGGAAAATTPGGGPRREGGRKKRAGELYDAFAEGSEDEGDRFSVGDDEDEEGGGATGRYKDNNGSSDGSK